MAQETNLSKRERQKQRRQEKLARERAVAARQRRTRLLGIGLVALLIVGGIGYVVAQQVAARNARQANIEAANARLADLGCTPIEELPAGGAAAHLSSDQLASSPPEVLYADRPTTGGPHIGAVAAPGVYDKVIDERLLVHDMEHGHVLLYYTADADPDQVDELKTWAQEQLDGDFPELVVSQWDGELPDGAHFASTAWGWRQMCRDFDTGVTQAFLDQHYNSADAPEQRTPAGVVGSQGVFDPNAEDGPLLFPPLDAVDPEEEEQADQEPAGSGEGASEEPSDAPASEEPATEEASPEPSE